MFINKTGRGIVFMINPLVSVVMPVYNSGAYLEECLDSVLNQTLREFEVLCVDDGSEDNSYDILKRYADKDKRIKIFRQENLGAALARKNALSNACGKFAFFLDSDDKIERVAFEKLCQNIDSNKSDIVCFKYWEYDGENKIPFYDSDLSRFMRKGSDSKNSVVSLKAAFAALLDNTNSKMFSLLWFNKYDDWFFPEKKDTLIEDLPLNCQLFLRASSISFCDEFLYYYRNYRQGRRGSVLDVIRNSEYIFGIFNSVNYVETFMKKFSVFDELFFDFALFKISHLKGWYEVCPYNLKNMFFDKLKEAFLRTELTTDCLKKVRYDNYVFYLNVLKSKSYEELEINRKSFKFYFEKVFYKLMQSVK